MSKHHLVPRSEGGTAVVGICAVCHKTIHSFFTNRTLARELASIEALRKHPKVQKYLSWVSKQPDRRIRVRSSRDKS